jgi:diadenosine tetraphosphate (Ap4A) HIT family hydrolase
MATTQKVAQRIREVFQPKRVGVHIAGTEVPHAHVHVFPFNTESEFWNKPSNADPDHAALAEIAKKLAF